MKGSVMLGLKEMVCENLEKMHGIVPDRTLIMKYKSPRGLIDFAVGMVRGAGKLHRENLKVTKLGNDRIEIIFL